MKHMIQDYHLAVRRRRLRPERRLADADEGQREPGTVDADHGTTDREGFEPSIPLRAYRFSRPAVSTAHPSVQRTGWDSNPRNGCPLTRFPSVRLQPLGHPSQRRLGKQRLQANGDEARIEAGANAGQLSAMTVTYSSYLRLDELLALQQPRPGELEHDETLFVIIHQVYELWFKEVLHEMDYLQERLRANDTALAGATLKRILTILKTLVAQIDVLETMTPLNFLSFRDRLEAGSGFQSQQFREIEALLGKRARPSRRSGQPTLWDAFLYYLATNDYPV